MLWSGGGKERSVWLNRGDSVDSALTASCEVGDSAEGLYGHD